jgi:integrase/recombinase XerD
MAKFKLSELKTKFLNYLKNARGIEKNSIEVYEDRLKYLDRLSFTEEYLLTIKSKLQKKFKPRYISSIFTTLKAFHSFLKKEKIVNGEFPEIRIKTEEKIKPYIEDIEQFTKIVSKQFPKYELHIRLMLFAGLRISEAFKIRKKNITFYDDHIVIRVIGKRNKERMIPVYDKRTIELMQEAKEITPPCHPKHLNKILYIIGKKMKTYITPHILRHTYATNLYKKGVPLDIIQKLLGHSNITTTQIYAKITPEHLEQILKNVSF